MSGAQTSGSDIGKAANAFSDGAGALKDRGFSEDLVRRVLKLVVQSEYKRRQAAPALRVTARAFGEGWRFPIAHGYRH